MFKSCGKCGKIHKFGEECQIKRKYDYTQSERKTRSKYAWTLKSKEIKEKASYLCEVCFNQGIYNYKRLEVHHIKKLREFPELAFDDYNLICLCEEHHTQADKGILSIEYLESLANKREERNK